MSSSAKDLYCSTLLRNISDFRNLCRALMLYGSPSHRLEESLKATARSLEIDGNKVPDFETADSSAILVCSWMYGDLLR